MRDKASTEEPSFQTIFNFLEVWALQTLGRYMREKCNITLQEAKIIE